ncbi:MAG: aldehyde dehydrogenase (NADP(+)) [Phycisphaerales bacterium]|nr:aldehyde dehydrogenase (NADP(+)) [Phycisphaerales bacterium]
MTSSFKAYQPALGTFGEREFKAASSEEVASACAAAAQAFLVLSSLAPQERAKLLRAIAAGVHQLGDRLLNCAASETGLPMSRLAAERDRTIRQLELYATMISEGEWVEAVIDHGDPKRQPNPKPDIRRMLRPLGPVAVFSASNFPLAYSVCGGDTASALAAGCPVVVKGHSAHPETGEMVAAAAAEAVRSCGLPPGCFKFLQCGGDRDIAAGLDLIHNSAIRAAGFTGSLVGGMALVRAAMERPQPIPVFAEMGSVNPVFVLPGALSERGAEIARAVAAAKSNYAGQMCTCPGLVFLVRSAPGEAFIDIMAQSMAEAGELSMLTQRTQANWLSRINALESTGARVVIPAAEQDSSASGVPTASGAAKARDRATASRSHLVRPVLLRTELATLRSNSSMLEEAFGPSSLIVECDTLEQMLEAAGCLIPGCLAGSMWMTPADMPEAAKFHSALLNRAGRVIVNGLSTGVEVCDAMVHSGEYPACSRPDTTAVGSFAIRRWCRPVAFQNTPEQLLPPELQESNPLGIIRHVDGHIVPISLRSRA